MMEGISSLKIPGAGFQEGPRSSQRPSQGTERAAFSGGGDRNVRESKPEADQVAALAEELNQSFKQIEGNFSVSVDDATGMVVVRITDAETGEIVKQIPPQQLLDASVSVEKIIGLLVNDQA